MNTIINAGSNLPHTSNINRNHSISGVSYTKPIKQDVFFTALNKPYKLAKAKSEKDIPDDANIFLFTSDAKVKLPPGRDAKECILSDKGFGFWTRFFGGEEANGMVLKSNHVDYAHGDLTLNRRTKGLIEVDNAEVNQLENVTMVILKNNANVKFIDKVDNIDAFDSTMGNVNIEDAIHLNGNCKLDSIKAYTVIAYPGDYIKNSDTNLIACKENKNKPGVYTIVDNAKAAIGAEFTQAKVGKLKANDLIFNDSIGDDIEANCSLEFSNSVVNHLKLGAVKKMSDCKIKRFDLDNAATDLKMFGKIQIDQMNLRNDEGTIFIFPKTTELGEKVDNYIKELNIVNDYPCPNPRPRIKIQGPIDIEKIEFKNNAGVIDITRPEDPNKPIKIINGYLNYDAPESPVPKIDDMDV